MNKLLRDSDEKQRGSTDIQDRSYSYFVRNSIKKITFRHLKAIPTIEWKDTLCTIVTIRNL